VVTSRYHIYKERILRQLYGDHSGLKDIGSTQAQLSIAVTSPTIEYTIRIQSRAQSLQPVDIPFTIAGSGEGGALTPEDVLEVERLANRYVWEDHPIDISFPSPDQLEALDYRSKKALTGQVRIVAWPGADCCACCGTHVRSSGQVGMIKLVSCQNFREGVRIELAAGGRALDWSNRISRQNTLVSQLLSAKPDATAAAVERLQKELYALHGRVSALEEEDFARKAAQYAGAGDVLLLEPPMSPESLRKLCGAVQAGCGGCCAVFAGEGESYQYAAGCPDRDLRPLCKELNAALNGRGGGKPAFVQGSVQAGAEAIRGFFGGRHPFS